MVPFQPQLGELFLIACQRGDAERAQALLDQGVNVDMRNMNQQTMLILASLAGRGDLVALLCERKANLHAGDVDGETAVMGACFGGHLGIVEALHENGANIHQQSSKRWNALHFAAFRDHLLVCEFLLSKGADLTAMTSQGLSALNEYGIYAHPRLSPETTALRRAALEAAWAAGPHPSQVQRRRDERWARRGPLLTVLAEHAYRPLRHRALAIALAAASLNPVALIEAVALTTSQQRHAFLLGRVFSNEGIVRLLAALL